MEDVIVRVEHLREAKMCVRGVRQWFARHGLDFDRFLTEGIPASEVEALNDALGNMVVKIARDAAAGDGA